MVKTNNVWAIIPGYNEAKHIGDVISEVKKYCKNIVVVDDGSKDKTYEIASSKNVTVLHHVINLGKGAALRTGCDYALEKGAEILIAIDSDGQHEPREINEFLKKLKGKDIVFGYRKFSKNMPFVFRFGNRSINLLTQILYGINLQDTQCGYRAFTSNAYKKIRWDSSDYAMESEMIANAGKYKLKHAEHEIRTIYADKYKGTTVMDGVNIVINMLLWRFKK